MPRETMPERLLGWLLGSVLAAVVLLPLLVGLSLYRGWALMLLWNWFITPLGAPALGLAGAIGIALCVNFLTEHAIAQTKSDSPREAKAILGKLLLGPLVAVLFGAAVKHFL